MLKKINNKKIMNLTKICITTLLLAQPIFDIIKASEIHDIQIFGLSFFEIFNIVLVFFLGLLAIFQSQQKKRFIRYLIFGIIFLIYFVLHCYNMTLFNNEVYPNHTLNFFVEFYYLYKTFINPLILMMSLYYIGIDKNYLIKIIQIFSLIISTVIIVGDIFGFGYMSYGEGNSRCLKSIFDWYGFENNYRFSFYELTCKGLYFSANQISSITFMIFPILLYSTYKNRKAIDYISLIFMIICMYMLGTKVSTYGVLAVFIMFYLLYVFFSLYNKYTNNNIKLNNIMIITIVFVFSLLLFFISPRRYEMKFDNIDMSSVKLIEDNLSSSEIDSLAFLNEWEEIKKIDCYEMTEEQEKEFLNFFDKYSGYMGVSSFIIKSYDSHRYPEFWCNYLKTSKNNNYRVLKTSILRKIYTDNNNKLDKFFGLGYNLNYIYTESDYDYQFYSYGIVGCIIFLSGYFIAIICSIYRILKDKKRLFNFENILLLSAPAIALLTANFSGHVLERTMPLLTLAILCSLVLISNQKVSETKK
ncbi:MAG: O-antigen ligase family protein [Bacilli bacterium]